MSSATLPMPFLAAVLLAAACLQLVSGTLSEPPHPHFRNQPGTIPDHPIWQAIQRQQTATGATATPLVWPTPLTVNLVVPGDYGTYNDTVCLAVSPEEASHITHIHNQLRGIVATGLLKNLPPAADMHRLNYDLGLAWRAQVHSQSCKFQHGCLGCGKIQGFMGQNLFLAPEGSWAVALMTWFNEFQQAGPDIIRNYYFSPSNAHFTQMLWSRNTKVGCGATECPELGGRYLVCNYEPGGNLVGQPVYHEGYPCSQCPEGNQCEAKDRKFTPKLCGTERGYGTWIGGLKNHLVPNATEQRSEFLPNTPL
ncbi:scoloptoxin SSD976-like [Haemaphysalis longicornis]